MITNSSDYISYMATWCKIKYPILFAEMHTDEEIISYCIDKTEFQGMLNTCSTVMVQSVKNITKEFFERLLGDSIAASRSINCKWCICVGLSMREWKDIFDIAIKEYQPDTFHEEIFEEVGEMCRILHKDFPSIFEREYHTFFPEKVEKEPAE